MKWKEFFYPNWKKIILTIVLTIIFSFWSIYFGQFEPVSYGFPFTIYVEPPGHFFVGAFLLNLIFFYLISCVIFGYKAKLIKKIFIILGMVFLVILLELILIMVAILVQGQEFYILGGIEVSPWNFSYSDLNYTENQQIELIGSLRDKKIMDIRYIDFEENKINQTLLYSNFSNFTEKSYCRLWMPDGEYYGFFKIKGKVTKRCTWVHCLNYNIEIENITPIQKNITKLLSVCENKIKENEKSVFSIMRTSDTDDYCTNCLTREQTDRIKSTLYDGGCGNLLYDNKNNKILISFVTYAGASGARLLSGEVTCVIDFDSEKVERIYSEGGLSYRS